MKRGGPLKTDAAKMRAWQARGATKFNAGGSRVVIRKQMKKPVRRNDAPWRKEVIELRGAFCRRCLGRDVQCDHVWPRSQGGPSVVENGLLLCRACHEDKTASRIVIEFGWLDADQIPWLAKVGWVAWDDDGQPRGRGWRHFGVRKGGADER